MESVSKFASRTSVRLTEEVVEHSLSTQNQCAHEDSRFPDCEETHEVHALVLGFLEQCMDPACITSLIQMVSRRGAHRSGWDAP